MSAPTEPADGASAAFLTCAVGLLLTVVEVTGFGFDFANDTLGFALVCAGATRLPRIGGSKWVGLTVVSAGLAALVSLFTYGGPAGQVLALTYRVWNVMFYLDTLTAAGVVTGLLMVVMVRIRMQGGPGAWMVRGLPPAVGLWVLAALLSMVLFASQAAYYGPLGQLRQVVGVLVGGLQVLTVVAAFLAAHRDPVTD